MPYPAGEAASTNRANRPGARRRRRAAPCSADRLLRPHHEAATKAHRSNADIDESCVLPRTNGPRNRVTLVVCGNVGPEETSDPTPRTTAGEKTRDRQHTARVQPPPEPPEALGRYRELQARDLRARLEHSPQL